MIVRVASGLAVGVCSFTLMLVIHDREWVAVAVVAALLLGSVAGMVVAHLERLP